MKVLKIGFLVVFISLGCLLSGCGETETDKHFRQGYEYYSQGEYEQAIAELQKVIEIDPNYLDTHVGLGLVYRQQSKLDDAITKYQHNKYFRLNPTMQCHILVYEVFTTYRRNMNRQLLNKDQSDKRLQFRLSTEHLSAFIDKIFIKS